MHLNMDPRIVVQRDEIPELTDFGSSGYQGVHRVGERPAGQNAEPSAEGVGFLNGHK